jgi:Heparinase II/III-like protein/Heparinase II/III N-terminus
MDKRRTVRVPKNRPIRELLKRLADMSSDEIRVRSLQELTKRWDLARHRLGIGYTNHHERSRTSSNPRFFFGDQDIPQISQLISDRLPQTARDIVDRAERIRAHRFDLLGYRDLDYGPDIDWHLDIVHGKRAPQRPWFKIRYLDFEEAGDCKITWELSRHQHLVTLAKAYRLTGQESFLRELVEQWYHWQRNNEYPIGINWASSLEVAFRSLSWLWLLHLLQDPTVHLERFFSDLRQSLCLNARHIERYMSTYFSPNTHLLGEAVALFFIGILCPEHPRSRRWREEGWQIVLEQAEQQVRADGMHFEQSLYYHAYATDFFLHASILAKRNGVEAPASFHHSLEQMLDALFRLGQSGVVPQFGDDDGGRLFDPHRNRAEHLLDPLATGAVLFRRPDFKVVAREIREETIWLLGISAAQIFEALDVQPIKISSSALDASGIHVCANSDPLPQQLVIDAGPQGAGRAGHGHADALSVQLSIGGRRLLVDPGTFCYVSDKGERGWFRGTAAHNTLRVDNCDQAEPSGPFGWRQLPRVEIERWTTGDTFDLFAASHTGYLRLAHPVQHKRYVFHLKSHFWLVRDVISGIGSHQLDLYWHIGPHLALSEVDSALLVTDGERPLLGIVRDITSLWEKEITSGRYSAVYGIQEPSAVLHFSTERPLPAEFATVLAPNLDEQFDAGSLRTLTAESSGASVAAYVYSASGVCYYTFFAEANLFWRKGRWTSDASLLFCELDSADNLRHMIVCNGSYVDINDRRVFASSQPVVHFEWQAAPNGNIVRCSSREALLFAPDSSVIGPVQNSRMREHVRAFTGN